MPELEPDVVLGAFAGFVWFILVNMARGVPLFAGVSKRSARMLVHAGFIAVAVIVANYTALNFVGGVAVGWAVTEGPQQTLFKGPRKTDEDLDDLSSPSAMGSRLRRPAWRRLADWYYGGQ